MNADGLKARIERLDQLINGLAQEADRMRKTDRHAADPLVPVELLAYASHLDDATRWLKRARQSIANAHARLSASGA